MLWRLAGADPLRYPRLLTVPLRDCCAAYEQALRHEAVVAWQVEQLMWANGVGFGAKGKQPPKPAILNEV